MSSDHSRPKIVEFLIDRITRDISELNLSEKTHFVTILRNIEDETAVNVGQVEHQTTVEAVLKTIEPYLMDDIAVMNVEDLTNTFVAYSHPHVSKRPGILDILETKIIMLAQQPKGLSMRDCSSMLHSFATH